MKNSLDLLNINYNTSSIYTAYAYLTIVFPLSILSRREKKYLSKLKALADDKLNVPKSIQFVYLTVETIVGHGENAGNQHFLLFPHFFFKRAFSSCASRIIIV